jgi:ABC-type multidrug transport system fused ATPase/permease subunit
MVLDAGKLVEFDAPQRLLDKPDGVFKGLWSKHQLSHGTSSGSLNSLSE